jgi:hypothetical protein
VSFHLKDHYTQRRLAIMDGLITLAEHDAGDEVAVTLVGLVTDRTSSDPTGALVGRLGATDARLFNDACRRYVGQPVTTDRVTELFGATDMGAA